jgi:hypothetical protein
MTVLRLGDGEPTLSPTLGGGPLGADVFDFGNSGLFLALRAQSHQEALLAVAMPRNTYTLVSPLGGTTAPQDTGGGGGGSSGGGTDSDPPDTGSGNNGSDGDAP